MKTKSRRRTRSAQEVAATKHRTFRTFLLMSQFEAKEIGQRIAEARTVAGLTQEELAEMASFSKRSLQDYEAGVTIPYRHMKEISQLLGREVEWFLHGADPMSDDRLQALEEKLTSVLEGVTTAVEALTARVDQLSGGAERPAARRK